MKCVAKSHYPSNPRRNHTAVQQQLLLSMLKLTLLSALKIHTAWLAAPQRNFKERETYLNYE